MILPPRKRITPWIVAAICLILAYVALVIYFLNSPPMEGTALYRLTGGFNGNIASGVLVILFFLIALHTDAQTESKIERIKSVVENHDYRQEIERKINEFERFLKERRD